MKKPEKADYERVKDSADRESIQLAIQTDINKLISGWIERKLGEFPDKKPTGVG